MIQSLLQIKNRIRSIENTRKVTNALELISVAKYNQTERVLAASRPFFMKMESLLARCASATITHPLYEQRQARGKPAVLVVTSDSGLCGTYNNNVLRCAEKFLSGYDKRDVKIVAVGRKGFGYFKKRQYVVPASYVGLNGRYREDVCAGMGRMLEDLFLSGEVDGVYAVYSRFITALSQKAVVEQLLPLAQVRAVDEDCIYEPDRAAILAELIPRYSRMKLRLMLVEGFASEHSSRTLAMKLATDNAKELLQGLVLLRNKVRQARITQDIMEIISSAEALKG